MTTFTSSASLIGNACAFVAAAGTAGVADAIEYGMMGQNIPLVVGVVRNSLPTFPDENAEVRQAVDTYFDKGPSELRPYYYKTVLCPTLRTHSAAIDRAIRSTRWHPERIQLHEHAGTPTLHEVLEYLTHSGTLRFVEGLRTAMFGQEAVDAAFSVYRDALDVARQMECLTIGAKELLDVVDVYGAIAHLGATASAIPLYCDVLMRNVLAVPDATVLTVDAIVRAFRGGTSPNDQIFYTNVEELNFSQRTKFILLRNNVRYLGELCRMSEQELLRLNQFNRKSLREVKDFLNGLDLSLGMQVGKLNPYYTSITRPLAPADYDGAKRGKIFQIRLDSLELPSRTVAILRSAGIVCIGDLCRKTANQLLNKPITCGRKVLKDSERILATMGLSLGMKI